LNPHQPTLKKNQKQKNGRTSTGIEEKPKTKKWSHLCMQTVRLHQVTSLRLSTTTAIRRNQGADAEEESA
jgi:hypothetical protein